MKAGTAYRTGSEISEGIMRERKGSVKVKNGKFYAVIRWTDHNGRKRETMRRAQTRAEARRLIRELLAALEQRGETGIRPECKTFADLANWFESNDAIPAQYSGGRKIAGRRAVEDVRLILKFQREYFSTRDLRSISWADLDKYRRDRLATPTRQGRERSIAAVNRELAVLRKMFGIAAREGWILSNPFLTGKGLIDTASERKRDRVLSADEERQLLAGCKAAEARNDYIYLLTLFGVDTGMRQGEIMALQWGDVDLQNGRVTVRALNTKTLRERTLQLSRRVLIELQARRARLVATDAEATRERIFENLKDFPKDGFNNAVKRAGLADFRFHDLRHTWITRLIEAGMPIAQVGRLAGHTQISTTYRYVSQTSGSAEQAAGLIDTINARHNVTPEQSPELDDGPAASPESALLTFPGKKARRK